MTDNWTAKIEYLFADFQAASCGAANCLAVPTASVNFDESMVRGGINYKFYLRQEPAKRLKIATRRNPPGCCFFALFRALPNLCTAVQIVCLLRLRITYV